MGLIIYLDTQEAKLFHLLPEGMKQETIRRTGARHPVETNGKNHPIEQTDEERFYHDLCQRLEKVEQKNWFLAGAGPARNHFMAHIRRHHPQLETRVKENQKLDHLTDAQIVDEGMKFFRHAYLFGTLDS